MQPFYLLGRAARKIGRESMPTPAVPARASAPSSEPPKPARAASPRGQRTPPSGPAKSPTSRGTPPPALAALQARQTQAASTPPQQAQRDSSPGPPPRSGAAAANAPDTADGSQENAKKAPRVGLRAQQEAAQLAKAMAEKQRKEHAQRAREELETLRSRVSTLESDNARLTDEVCAHFDDFSCFTSRPARALTSLLLLPAAAAHR